MVQITKNKIAKVFANNSYYTEKYDTPRKFENAVNREYKKLMEIYNTPLVKTITIDINWSRSGHPSADYFIRYVNGHVSSGRHPSLTGWGYEKRIPMFNNILNAVARQNLFHKRLAVNRFGDNGYSYSPEEDIAPKYDVGGRIDGKFKYYTIDHVAWSKTYDKYIITFKN